MNKRFFATDRYVCVDINEQKVRQGHEANPDAEVFVGRIQEFFASDRLGRANVAVCVQTMGTNAHFEHAEIVDVIRQMYQAVSAGGGIIFNVGNKADRDALKEEMLPELRRNFERVKVRNYGALHREDHECVWWKSLFLAFLMFALPTFRNNLFKGQDAVRKTYVVCEQRIRPSEPERRIS